MRTAVAAVWTIPCFVVLVFFVGLDALSGINHVLHWLVTADVAAMFAFGVSALIGSLRITSDTTRRYAMLLSVPPILFSGFAALYLYTASHLFL